MQDDRDRYLPESDVEADGWAEYFFGFTGASEGRRTMDDRADQLRTCDRQHRLSYYKAYFKRVRASFFVPGLVPPFGPPAHPSFQAGIRSWAISSRCCLRSRPSDSATACSTHQIRSMVHLAGQFQRSLLYR